MTRKEGATPTQSSPSDSLRATLSELRPGEGRLVLASGLYFFCLLAAYYALRPMRDSFGSGSVHELHWLFTGTFAATLIAQPIYGHLVARRGRAAFIPLAYRFLALNAILFGVLFGRLEGESLQWAKRAYFVWLSFFAVIGVSVFWGFMADTMGSARAKRLYGLIAIGGSLGAALGSTLAGWWMEAFGKLVRSLGASEAIDNNVLLPLTAALLIEGAVRAARAVERTPLVPERGDPDVDGDAPLGGTALAGFVSTARSPYLLAICAYVLIFVVASSTLYYITSDIVNASYAADERTAFYGRMDLIVNVGTLLLQVFATGHLMRRLGLGVSLAAVPLAGLVGFGVIASAPSVAALAVLFVCRRTCEFAFSKPAREALFTVVPREDKYKAKAIVDTVIYRGGDAMTLWVRAGLATLGVTSAGFAWGMVPVTGIGLALALWLGRAHARREARGS